MSLITFQIRNSLKESTASGRTDRAPVNVTLSKVIGHGRKAITRGARLLMHSAEVFAEARRQKAMIEAELYLNRYKHSSKNDDDLPIAR